MKPLLCGALGSFLLLAGCTGSVANLTGATSGSTVLKGPNAAIGGVNYSSSGSGKDAVWDRHITGCRHGADHQYVFTGDGADLLLYRPDAGEPLAILHGPAGQISFPTVACSVAKLSVTGAEDGKTGTDGKLALVCDANSHQLNASVRFERCGA